MSTDGGGCAEGASLIGKPSDSSSSSSSSSFPWRDLRHDRGEWDTKASSTVLGAGRGPWTHLVTSEQNGITVSVFSRPVLATGISEYKICGTLPLEWATYLANHLDFEYRKQWDTCSKNEPGDVMNRSRIVHQESKYTSLISMREYIYEQRVHMEADDVGKPMCCITAQAISQEKASDLWPLRRGVVRVDEYTCHLLSWSLSDVTTCFSMHYLEDAKMPAPGWLVRKICSSTLPAQFGAFCTAAQKYPLKHREQTLRLFNIKLDAESLSESPTREPTEEVGESGSAYRVRQDSFFSASEPEEDEAILDDKRPRYHSMHDEYHDLSPCHSWDNLHLAGSSHEASKSVTDQSSSSKRTASHTPRSGSEDVEDQSCVARACIFLQRCFRLRQSSTS